MTQFKFHGFATHSWAEDEEKRDTHKRVVHVCQRLRASHGIQMWVDEERMTGNIQEAMCQGIEESETFVVFLTLKYVTKVSQQTNLLDNCKLEFQFGIQERRPKTILVMMEKAVLNKANVKGLVKMHLGLELYLDLSDGDLPSDAKIGELAAKINSLCENVQQQPQSAAPLSSAPVKQALPDAPINHKIFWGHNVFEGTVLSGTKDRGVGEFKCPDYVDVRNGSKGATFTGSFVGDKMSGNGVLVWAGGDRYDGAWDNGNRSGKGTHYWTDGQRYEGEWKVDKKDGKGTHYWADGQRFEGDFKGGMPHGKGTHYFANGTAQQQEWNNGTCVRSW